MATEFSPSISLLPPSTNPALVAAGPLALYNPTLLLIATALSQHALVFGFFFLLRGFSAKRVFDTHYLTFLLVLTLSLAGLIFLIDPGLDNFKIFFLLEHEAVEVVISLRVLLPTQTCKNRAGFILFCLWGALSTVSVIVSLSDFYHHGADLVAWGAFCSDFLLAVSGIMLVKRWFDLRPRFGTASSLQRAKVCAEALAGIGFILHGFSTMCIGPIFVRVVYYNADPNWFAYGFAWVFMFAIFAVAFMVPCVTVFFGTIRWCCWHERKVLPGQAQWEDGDIFGKEAFERKQMLRGAAMDVYHTPSPYEGT